MKEKIKTVFVKDMSGWNPQEFRFLKAGDVFSFDKEQIFTASCGAYIIENDGMWSILTTNKGMEEFLEHQRIKQKKTLL